MARLQLKGGLSAEAVPYERARHAAFVVSTWCWGSKRPREGIEGYLRRADTRCLVAHSPADEECLMGWAAVSGEREVVWCFSRELRCRQVGLMTSLLMLAGVDISRPTACLNWSADAAAVAARDGYRPYFAPHGGVYHAPRTVRLMKRKEMGA